MKRERGLFFLVPEGRFSGGQEGDSWWDENKNGARKSSVYAGFRALVVWFECRLSTKYQEM